jgi:hypothetical protein
MGEKRNACKMLVGKPEERLLGRPSLKKYDWAVRTELI